jgi:predicted GH43/DUF377 family glycosyl hydrolase
MRESPSSATTPGNCNDPGAVPEQWERRGLVFAPDGRWWQRSHAALPTVLPLGGGLCRVYFTSRDERQRSHVGWFDLDLDGSQVVEACAEPVLAPGVRGHYDGDGVWAASAVRDRDRVRLYTIGWNAGAPPLYYPSIGLAFSEDGGRTFAKHGRTPVLARSEHDPWMVSGPHVLHEDGRWRMWYLSGQGWDDDGHSAYDVKHAESDDGIAWRRDGRVCLGEERNTARACVLRDGGRYRAWFSSDGGEGYRIRYAESPDGLDWERVDGWGLEPAGEGWESGAVAYPFVVRHGDRLVMLYNGDGFGRAGIGLAVRPYA